MLALLRLDIQEHDDEEEEHDDGPGVDQDLEHSQKVGPQQDEKSRSQIKREFRELKDLAKQLARLSEGQLRTIPLSEKARDALLAASSQGVAMTDEASAMEAAGHPVQLVPGSAGNLKVTVPADLDLAAWYLGRSAACEGESTCE